MEMKPFGDLKIGDEIYVMVCGKCLFSSEHVLKVIEVNDNAKNCPKDCVYLRFNENIYSVNRDNLVVKKKKFNWTTIPLNDFYIKVSTIK